MSKDSAFDQPITPPDSIDNLKPSQVNKILSVFKRNRSGNYTFSGDSEWNLFHLIPAAYEALVAAVEREPWLQQYFENKLRYDLSLQLRLLGEIC